MQLHRNEPYSSTNKTMVSTTNDADALAEQFGNLSTYTTPSPTSSLAFKYDRFADDDPPKPRPIPRYLFRVYSSHSAGKTSASIIQSKAACSNSPEIREMSRACIFSKRLRYLASDIAVKHLMRKLPNNEDNLISWTSSILFAIVYIFYHNIHYGAPRQDIHLCVIDTKRFRSKTFICDRDLMDVLKKDTDDWNSLVRWRRSTRLYFGEYLSQGSMNVVGKCVVVSAAQLFDEGLLDIHDRFPQLERQMQRERKTKLASIICDFRDNWPQNAVKLEQTRAEAIVKVADLFGRRWRLPVALSLVSLHHYSNVAWTLGTAFEEKSRHLGGLTGN